MSRLDEAGVIEALRRTPGWERTGAEIRRTYRFGDFREALAFVNRVGELAERAGHHPDIDIRYDAVTLALSTSFNCYSCCCSGSRLDPIALSLKLIGR